MKIAFLALFLFSASLFVSPLPTAVSSETATQASGDLITVVPAEWLTEVAKSKNGKRIKVRYKLDIFGKPDTFTFEYSDRGRWNKAIFCGKTATGYYVTAGIPADKYYF